MAYHQTRVRPGGNGPLDHVEAYIDDAGDVHYPGDAGYVEPTSETEGGITASSEETAASAADVPRTGAVAHQPPAEDADAPRARAPRTRAPRTGAVAQPPPADESSADESPAAEARTSPLDVADRAG